MASCQRTRGARSVAQLPHGGLQRIRRLRQPRLGDADGGGTHLGRGVAQRRAARSPASSAPRPSSVASACSRVRGSGALVTSARQRRRHRGVAALDEQPLRGVAPPAVRVRQHRHQLRGRLRRQRGPLGARGRLVDHAVDAAEPGRLDQPAGADLVLQVLRLVLQVLDHAAVHVGDVERAVGGRQQVDRAEALVGRGEELALRMRVGRGEPAVGAFLHDVAAHQVARRLGDEDVAADVGRQPIAAIDGRRPGRLEASRAIRPAAARRRDSRD